MHRGNKKVFVMGLLLVVTSLQVSAQDDLMDLLEKESARDATPDFAAATFKTTRVINGHSVENVAAG